MFTVPVPKSGLGMRVAPTTSLTYCAVSFAPGASTRTMPASNPRYAVLEKSTST